MTEMFKNPLIGLLLVVFASFSLFLSASAQTCRSTTFTNRIYSACNDLPVLNSFLGKMYVCGLNYDGEGQEYMTSMNNSDDDEGFRGSDSRWRGLQRQRRQMARAS
ncbi:hypothetical protein Scep_014348 [Stephania cephalantha]|uniref:Uncharacterized protein n=1 Tax=Stephania cephalantha TaxID=152367 RepID=A0AAP0J0S8_9MAGN